MFEFVTAMKKTLLASYLPDMRYTGHLFLHAVHMIGKRNNSALTTAIDQLKVEACDKSRKFSLLHVCQNNA